MILQRVYDWGGGEVRLDAHDDGERITVHLDGEEHRFERRRIAAGIYRIEREGEAVTVHVAADERRIWIHAQGRVFQMERKTAARVAGKERGLGYGPIPAPMTGTLRSVLVEEGQVVDEGSPLFILEAMKMELTVRAGARGLLRSVRSTPGARVELGDPLAVLHPIDPEES